MIRNRDAGEFLAGKKSLRLPAYFPSISSVKTAMPPVEYLKLLAPLSALTSQYLVSAYDLFHCGSPALAGELIARAQSKGAVVLMDSGNYESFWKEDQAGWKREHFHAMLRAYPVDLAFCFDCQDPPDDTSRNVDSVVSGWKTDSAAAPDTLLVPIVHASHDALPRACGDVARRTGTGIIAVAERRLGDGFFQRAATVRAIRRALDATGAFTALHLLGTGNPTSIAIYTAMGADSFDGLEWCQTVVDHDSALLFHLSQADFFSDQTAWAESGLSFQARTLAHNLEFFGEWMRRLHAALMEHSLESFCRHNLTPRVFERCAAVFVGT
ncbi:queuine/archaeosine tRNA-ribosyltransferase [Paraburkholderia youngii]|uniref:hypothetical protein n=1 Tax=Paraburkholderia youngii TaxID=2782701 RepID=UPI003D20827A